MEWNFVVNFTICLGLSRVDSKNVTARRKQLFGDYVNYVGVVVDKPDCAWEGEKQIKIEQLLE